MSAKINPDLQKERNTATFNPHEFTIWWKGGQKKYEQHLALGKFSIKKSNIHVLHLFMCISFDHSAGGKRGSVF